MWHLIKDEHFRDNPSNPNWREGMDPYRSLIPLQTTDQPEVHEIITQMRRLFDEYDNRVLIGEIYLPVERLVQYYGIDLRGAHLPFNFQLILTQWDAREIARLITTYEAALPQGGWPNWVLGNHDQHRIVSRVGPAQARVAAMLLLTLRGTPTLYYGDEIGMHDVPIPAERVRDPLEKNVPGIGLGRDPERTPMQWNAKKNAGFTDGEPWLPVADDYREVNVEAARDNPCSLLTLYRSLIGLRRGEPALEVGSFTVLETDGDVLAYIRRAGGGSDFLIALNLSHSPQVLHCPKNTEGTIALSTYLDHSGTRIEGDLSLRADEGILVRLVR
jgi:alpha-glucosidase